MNNDNSPQLAHPPIVEAVVDIDCDLPAGMVFTSLEEPARHHFHPEYPGFHRQLAPYQSLKTSTDVRAATAAFQLLSEDQPQRVQVRRDGFSFNRLAPYSSLDDYLPEIERTWRLFVDLTSPVHVRRIGLRYINRILLPTLDGFVDLGQYLEKGPAVADPDVLELSSFLNQYSAIEPATGHQVNVTMTQGSIINERLPVIFDIEAEHVGVADPQVWENIQTTILSLRRLKNHIFMKSLTERCLNLFR